MTYGFEREAGDEYCDAARYYSEQREGLGEEFVLAVETAIEIIAKDPTRYQPLDDGLRVFRMKRFPYYLFYRHSVQQDHATFFAVMHHKRKPNYWKHRLPRSSDNKHHD